MQHCKLDAKNIGFYTKNMISGSLGAPWGVLGGSLGGPRGVRFEGYPLGPLFGVKGSLQGPPGSCRGGPFFVSFCCIFVDSIVKYSYFHFGPFRVLASDACGEARFRSFSQGCVSQNHEVIFR